MASAPSNNNLLLWGQLDADTTHDNSDVLRECDVIFLAVKPNMFQVNIFLAVKPNMFQVKVGIARAKNGGVESIKEKNRT